MVISINSSTYKIILHNIPPDITQLSYRCIAGQFMFESLQQI